jgi:TonB-linked SusC/RagA family outer membrane protein
MDILRRLTPPTILALALAFIGLPAAVGAQQQRGSVSGLVRAAATQRPIVGAQVYVPGTNLGVLTDAQGRYVLQNVPAGDARIEVQFLGYRLIAQTVPVAAGETATLNFDLQESAVALDEIVVTGTAGQARKREVGNSIATIAAQEIEVAPVRGAQDILTGRSTGVIVMANSGQPGSGAAIRLRGNNSIAMSNSPLVYVDGVRLFSNLATASGSARQGVLPINDIAPDDIDRIEIVKGAAAATLYGTEASGGVIQIFTKRGRAGTPQWTAEISGGFNSLGSIGPKSDPTGLFLKQCRGENLVDSSGNRFEDATCPPDGNWLQNGAVQRYSISVRGGAPELTYYVSAAYGDEEGVITNQFRSAVPPNNLVEVPAGGSKDANFRGNFSFRPTPTLDLALSSAYTRRKTTWIPDGNLANGFTLNVIRGLNNNFKNASLCTTTGLTACLTNGEILEKQNLTNNNDHFVSGLTVRWEPNERFAQRFTVGYDYNAADNISILEFGFSRSPLGSIAVQNWNHTTLSLDYVGTVRHGLFGAASTFSWGGQLFEDRNRQTNTSGADFSGPGDPTLTSGARRDVTNDQRQRVINAGFFGQELIGINDRLFITAGVRIDGNSAFGESFGLQAYPKVSASYVMSDLGFWPTSVWETFKLRGAIGEAGKAPGAFDASRTWEPVPADEAKPAFTPEQIGNPDLGPERTREIEVGFESSAFQGRFGAEFNYFLARTLDALVEVQYPPSQGFQDEQLENVGELENKGFELRLDGGLITSQAVDWRVRLNYTATKSRAIDLGGQEVSVGEQNFVKEGAPVPALYGAKVRNPDAFEEPSVVSDTLIGPTYPTRLVSFGTTLTLFNRLSLDVLGEFQGGHYLQNWTGFQNANRFVWRDCYEAQQAMRTGDPAALAPFTALERARCTLDRTKQDSDFFIQKADFFKLRTASLTYQFPQGWLPRVGAASFTLAARNLFKITDYAGIDPEVSDLGDTGINGLSRREYYNLPPTRSFLASLRVTF